MSNPTEMQQIDEQRAEIATLHARQEQAADLIRQAMTLPSAVRLVHDAQELARFETVVQMTLKNSPGRPAIVVSLFCRSKYESESAKSEKALHAMLDQDLYTAHSQLDRIVRRFEASRPYCIQTSSDATPREVPSNTLAVYMNMNPRNQLEALLNLHHRVVGNALAGMDGSSIPERLDHALVREVHKSKQTRVYVEIDVDTKDPETIRRFLERARDMIKFDYVTNLTGVIPILTISEFIVETRGGFHIVYRKDAFPTDMYKLCTLPEFDYEETARDGRKCKKKYFDIRGDVCVPVPGTLQGGFPVRMLTEDEFYNRVFAPLVKS